MAVAVVVGERLDLLQHLCVHQRHRDLVGETAHLKPLVGRGGGAGPVAHGEDAHELAPEPKRQDEHRQGTEVAERIEVPGERAVRGKECHHVGAAEEHNPL